MKKIGIAIAVVLLTLSACAGKPNSAADNPTANQAEAQTAAAKTETPAVVEKTQGEPREETTRTEAVEDSEDLQDPGDLQDAEDLQYSEDLQDPGGTASAGGTYTDTKSGSGGTASAGGTNLDIKTNGTDEKSQEKDDSGAENTMKLLIGEKEVPVTWEDNASVEELRELCPLTIRMSMYGSFEQVGPIGQSIVSDDVQTNTNYGDIVLYSGNQVVIFYGSNSWAYTRLGHVNLSQKEMSDLLSNGDTVITLK